MKIYKKVVIDIDTGKTVYEDSFEYHGQIAECKGGGSSTTTTVDPVYNAGMLELSQEQQDWADQLFNQYQYGVNYDPTETLTGAFINNQWVDEKDLPKSYTGQLQSINAGLLNRYDANAQTSEMEYLQNVVEANQELLGLQTQSDQAALQQQLQLTPYQTAAQQAQYGLTTAQAQAAQGLLPSQTQAQETTYGLTTAQNQAAMSLLPLQTQSQMELIPAQTSSLLSDYELNKLKNESTASLLPQKTALTSSYMTDAMKGLNVGQQQNYAQAEVQHGYKNARDTMSKNLSSYGLDPNSGMFASQNRNLAMSEAADIAGARTAARQTTEDTNFARKQAALSTLGA